MVVVIALAALAAAAQPAHQAAKIEFVQLGQPLIQQRLEQVTKKVSERRATLESLFQEAGCTAEHLSAQRVPHSREPNVICTLASADAEAGVIVVGGHFDLVATGMGAVDDWSGAALLPSLYQSLKNRPRRHRFVFIGFAAEEQGLYGSAEYVKKLSREERAGTRAMINLECLGTGPPKVWAHRADKRLLEAYIQVSGALHLEAAGSNVEKVGDDDSHPFLDAKIPVLTIHSITQETVGLLHNDRDQVAAINPSDYYTAYRLIASYLAYLDSLLE